MRTSLFVTTFVLAVCGAAAAQSAQPQPAKPGAPKQAAAPAKAAAPQAPAPQPPAPTAAPAAPAPTPAPAPAPDAAKPAAPQTPPAAPAPTAEAPEAYSYRAEGRRDPFLTLIGAGTGSVATSRRGEGATGLAVAEISVRGIMQSRGALVAMIMGPDNRTYIVHQGDKLLDGTIKTITPQGLIVVQEVNDPLSLVKQREVRKLLRSLEDAK
jgi:Tfp pilus assembly protein PilP